MPDVGIEGELSEKLSRLVDRVDRLERRTSVQIGHWRLRQDGSGNLIAENTRNGITRTVASE